MEYSISLSFILGDYKMENTKITKDKLDDYNSIICPICNEMISYQNEDGYWICPNCGVKIKLEVEE